jgi:hypothetical protein
VEDAIGYSEWLDSYGAYFREITGFIRVTDNLYAFGAIPICRVLELVSESFGIEKSSWTYRAAIQERGLFRGFSTGKIHCGNHS